MPFVEVRPGGDGVTDGVVLSTSSPSDSGRKRTQCGTADKAGHRWSVASELPDPAHYFAITVDARVRRPGSPSSLITIRPARPILVVPVAHSTPGVFWTGHGATTYRFEEEDCPPRGVRNFRENAAAVPAGNDGMMR